MRVFAIFGYIRNIYSSINSIARWHSATDILLRFRAILQMVKCLQIHWLCQCSDVCKCTICWHHNVNKQKCYYKYLELVFEVTKLYWRCWMALDNVKWPVICNAIHARQYAYHCILMLTSCIQFKFGLAELVMWYNCMCLELQMNYGKVQKPGLWNNLYKAYHISNHWIDW